jgi:glycosyltransferase involved in cell wall biosynthesis
MLAYIRALRRYLPRVAADLQLAEFGSGDNFDIPEQLGMPLELARLRPRLVHFPTPFVPRIVPWPHVVTVHDVIDLEFPQYAKRKVGPYWRQIVAPVLRSSRAVITDDDVTATLLTKYVRVDPGRIRIVPLGVDAPDPLPQPLTRPRPYLFYAGNHRPHKDLPTLIRAWSTLPREYGVDFVLTGVPEPAFAGNRREHGELLWLGDRKSEEIWRFHRGAAAYVHAALREGFGLPLLEAMRVGTPVIAAAQSVPSVLAGHVQTFPAGDVDAARALFARVLDDPMRARDRAAHARTETTYLTWERTVQATADVYREFLA